MANRHEADCGPRRSSLGTDRGDADRLGGGEIWEDDQSFGPGEGGGGYGLRRQVQRRCLGKADSREAWAYILLGAYILPGSGRDAVELVIRHRPGKTGISMGKDHAKAENA